MLGLDKFTSCLTDVSNIKIPSIFSIKVKMTMSEENGMETWNKPNLPPSVDWLMTYVK